MVTADGRLTDDASGRVRSPAHGFCDDEATRRLLRLRPPKRALRWAERHLGGRVVSTRALRGGMSSAVHLLTVERPGGERLGVVLRRYVRPDVNADEPDLAEREARTLRFAEQLEVTTPRLVALDPTGDDAGLPALIMTRLAGRLDWWPTDPERWLHRLAELLPQVHGAVLPEPGVVRAFAPDTPASWEPPPWARKPRIWERAVEIYHQPPSELGAVFVHGDFHPGNVLWQRGKVTGLVDWQAARVGPSSRDVATCRGNLFTYGLDVAERFTHIWERLSGERFYPWAELVGIIGDLDSLREEPAQRDYPITEEVLGRAVAELSGGS